MGRLDQLDLSLSLSKKEYAERLAIAHTRLATLRLALGGKLAGYEGTLGPAVAVAFVPLMLPSIPGSHVRKFEGSSWPSADRTGEPANVQTFNRVSPRLRRRAAAAARPPG